MIDDKILDLYEAYAASGRSRHSSNPFSDMIQFLMDQDQNLPISRELVRSAEMSHLLHDVTKVKLKAPVPNPPKAMITGPSWKKHLKDGRMPDFIFVMKPPPTIIGPGDNITIPREARQVVTEVELAIVIGKPGRYVSKEDAWNHIAGFTVFNDTTDYGLYREGTPRAVIRAKSYDTFAPHGPCITLKDQIGDVQNLELKLRLNGEERVRIRTSEMVYPIAHFVSSVSEVMTLQVGDVISTGCPEVVPVKPGDVVEAEIENIGTLRNQFVEMKAQSE